MGGSLGRDLHEEGGRAGWRAFRPFRRARLSTALADNREGLGMKVIAVMVQRYGVLCRELWDLNRESDMGAGRGIIYDDEIPTPVYESIIGNTRYSIIDLTIKKTLTATPVLPNTLQRLHLSWRGYSFPLILPNSLLELDFNLHSFVMDLALPETLQKLKLNAIFHQPVTLPGGLLSLYVGFMYYHPLLLPSGLKELKFHPNGGFDEPLILPSSLTSVNLCDKYNQPTVFPNGIKEIGVGSDFTQDITFPPSVRTIYWGSSSPVQQLPDGLLHITFSPLFDHPVTFPPSLQTVIFSSELPHAHPLTFNPFLGVRYAHPIALPRGLLELDVSRKYAGPLVLPEGLQKLTWGPEPGDDAVDFPASLKELNLTKTAQVTLPEGLVKFSFPSEGNTHVDLPATVEHVTWFPDVGNTFTHPSTLQHLTVGRSPAFREIDLLKHKMTKLR